MKTPILMDSKITFIALTLKNETNVYINVDKIEAINTEGKITYVRVPSHNNGGFPVKETPQEIFTLINNS